MSAIERTGKCRKISASAFFTAAHSGLVAGSSPAGFHSEIGTKYLIIGE
jgi:hypothetical protein